MPLLFMKKFACLCFPMQKIIISKFSSILFFYFFCLLPFFVSCIEIQKQRMTVEKLLADLFHLSDTGGYLMGVVWVVFVTLKDTSGFCNGKQKEILYISVVWFKRNVLFYNFK